MALEVGPDLAKSHQVVRREVAVLGQRRVQNRRSVSLGEDEAISLRPPGVRWVVTKHAVVEGGDDVRGGEGAVEIARLGDGDHPHAVHPQYGREALELRGRRFAVDLAGGLWLGIWDRVQVRHRRALFFLGGGGSGARWP